MAADARNWTPELRHSSVKSAWIRLQSTRICANVKDSSCKVWKEGQDLDLGYERRPAAELGDAMHYARRATGARARAHHWKAGSQTTGWSTREMCVSMGKAKSARVIGEFKTVMSLTDTPAVSIETGCDQARIKDRVGRDDHTRAKVHRKRPSAVFCVHLAATLVLSRSRCLTNTKSSGS